MNYYFIIQTINVSVKRMANNLSNIAPPFIIMIIATTMILVGCESPDPSLVFSSYRNGNLDIYSINPTTLEEVNLTNSRYDESKPIVTQNGNEIVFLTKDANRYFIETMPRNGGPRKQLTANSNN